MSLLAVELEVGALVANGVVSVGGSTWTAGGTSSEHRKTQQVQH